MLTPEELQSVTDTMLPLLDDLNQWITRDMVRRLVARLDRDEGLTMTGTDYWQGIVYQEAGGHMEALQKQIAAFIGASEAEIAKIFEDVGLRAYASDAAVMEGSGISMPPLRQSKRMMEILEDTYRRTNGEILNFTRTTATASQKRLINALDTAHMKVVSGAQSYTAAVREAVDELANGQAMVEYPTGHTDTLETAVLRAVRTGTAQASGNMSMQAMEDHDWDIVLVSAHLGARYGDGGKNPGNHFWWQGQFYSRTGKTKDLPLFAETTGYGTGDGLSGWNCRHSFGPGDGVHNPFEQYDSEKNKVAYDLSQRQRKMERSIRRSKHKLLALRAALDACEREETAAELQEDYDQAAVKLRRQNMAYNDFCLEHGLKKLPDRIAVAKWNRSEAARASSRAKQEKN